MDGAMSLEDELVSRGNIRGRKRRRANDPSSLISSQFKINSTTSFFATESLTSNNPSSIDSIYNQPSYKESSVTYVAGRADLEEEYIKPPEVNPKAEDMKINHQTKTQFREAIGLKSEFSINHTASSSSTASAPSKTDDPTVTSTTTDTYSSNNRSSNLKSHFNADAKKAAASLLSSSILSKSTSTESSSTSSSVPMKLSSKSHFNLDAKKAAFALLSSNFLSKSTSSSSSTSTSSSSSSATTTSSSTSSFLFESSNGNNEINITTKTSPEGSSSSAEANFLTPNDGTRGQLNKESDRSPIKKVFSKRKRESNDETNNSIEINSTPSPAKNDDNTYNRTENENFNDSSAPVKNKQGNDKRNSISSEASSENNYHYNGYIDISDDEVNTAAKEYQNQEHSTSTRNSRPFTTWEEEEQYFQKIASDRGGFCVQPPPMENYYEEHAQWRCSIGHMFHASLKKIESTVKETYCLECKRNREDREKGKMQRESKKAEKKQKQRDYLSKNEIDEQAEEQENLFRNAKLQMMKDQIDKYGVDMSEFISEDGANAIAPDPDSTDPYIILGLPINASLSNIKKRFRELALKFHPDKSKSNDKAVKAFYSFRTAYESLTRDLR